MKEKLVKYSKYFVSGATVLTLVVTGQYGSAFAALGAMLGY